MNELEEYRDPGGGEDPPVTAVAARRVKPCREGEFEEWTSGILSAARGFPGFLGSNVVRPSGPEDDEYQIVFKFDHAGNLKRWEGCRERRYWLHSSEDLIEEVPNKEVPNIRILTGLETWFTLPTKEADPPPRYKMALVTWLAVFPLAATVVFMILDPLIGDIHTVLRTLVFTLVRVSLITYVVRPP